MNEFILLKLPNTMQYSLLIRVYDVYLIAGHMAQGQESNIFYTLSLAIYKE